MEAEFECRSVAVVTSDSNTSYGHGATAETHWAPDAVTIQSGIRLTCSSGYDDSTGIGSWSVTYDGPGGPFSDGGAVYLSDVSISVRPQSMLIYSKFTGSLWRILWNTMEVWVNGVHVTDLIGIDTVSSGVGPNYIPIIGMPTFMTPGGSVANLVRPHPGLGSWGGPSSYDPCNPAHSVSYSSVIEITVSGGWRFRTVDGGWTTLPVTKRVENPPNAGAGCTNLSTSGVLASTETYGTHITIRLEDSYVEQYVGREYASEQSVTCGTKEWRSTTFGVCLDACTGLPTRPWRDIYVRRVRSYAEYGEITLQPNLEHTIERLGNDHAALMYRARFPEIKGEASRFCTINGVTSTGSQEYITHPALSDFLGVVGNSDHALLDSLDYPFTPPCQVGKTDSEVTAYAERGKSICVCPPAWYPGPNPCMDGLSCDLIWKNEYVDTDRSEGVSWVFPSAVENAGGAHQYHVVAEARYLATWCNPFWIMGYWTGAEDLDGGPQTWIDYWGPIREQTFQNPALPVAERTLQRNHIILSPCEVDQGHTPFLDAFFAGLRWAGCSRWKTLTIDIPTSITLSLSRPGVWAARVQSGTPDCTVTLGAGGITLNAFAVAEVWVELDLAQWTADPWMLLQLATTVTVGWSGVGTVRVELVGFDDAVTVLGTTETTYAMFPTGRSQTKYAGAWGIENGNGVVTDLGVDQLGTGISSTIMADPATVMAMELARANTYKALRFVVTHSGTPFLIEWPTFQLAPGHPTAIWESGKVCAMIWPNGPAVRHGQNTWYIPGIGFQDPPVPTGLGVSSTMIDALATAKRLFTGTGTAALDTDITGDLADYVDDYEGPDAIGPVDKFGLGVPLPAVPSSDLIRVAMINSFAEVPPVSCFPTRKMRATTWIPDTTTSYWAGVYDWTQRTRYLISGGAQVRLRDDTGANVGGTVAAPSGWNLWSYAPPLTNDETNWQAVSGSTILAKLRPWHGFFVANMQGGTGKQNPGVLHTSEPRYVRATIDASSNVVVEHASFSTAPYMIETVVTSTGDCLHPCLALDPRASAGVILMYQRPLGVYERRSHDEAATWDTETMAFSGGIQPKIRSGNDYVVRAAFVYDSGTSGPGTIQCNQQGDGDPSIGANFAWKDSAGANLSVADTGFDFYYSGDEQHRWVASLTISGETSVSDWFSTDDCRTWKLVS